MARKRHLQETFDSPSVACLASSTPGPATERRRKISGSMRPRSRSVPEAPSEGFFEEQIHHDSLEPIGEALSNEASYRNKGKGRLAHQLPQSSQIEDTDGTASEPLQDESSNHDVCPITDKDEKPFHIMDLPTEIRLEIYRACLTRPYNILLSKQEQSSSSGLEKLEMEPGMDRREMEEFEEAATPSSSLLRRASTTNLLAAPPHRPRTIRLRVNRSEFHSAFDPQEDVALSQMTIEGPPPEILVSSSQTPYQRIVRRTLPLARSNISSSDPPRPQSQDPLLVNILRASKQIYKEARGVLYSENLFSLDLNTALSTLACLHQRSRRQIKHVELEIPTYNEILERFQETVRLSLRYCSGLRSFVIHMPFMLPGADGTGTAGNSTVYANGFDILRWLPQGCNVSLKGFTCVEIERVVSKHLHLAKTLDKLAYARRQLISNDASSAPTVASVV